MILLTEIQKKFLKMINEGEVINMKFYLNSSESKQICAELEKFNFIKVVKTIYGDRPYLNIEKLEEIEKMFNLKSNNTLYNYPLNLTVPLGTGLLLETKHPQINIILNEATSITSTLINNLDESQPYTYLMQVEDDEGITISLQTLDDTIQPNETKRVSLPWKSDVPGNYTARVCIWKNKEDPALLAKPIVINIKVKQGGKKNE